MNKENFSPNSRYVVTWRSPDGRLRPANLYVYTLFDDSLIARMLDIDGLLHKIPYADIIRIVRQQTVPANMQFRVPTALLEEKNWKDRDIMYHYSSGPGVGK